jgi:hypothetical protein
VYRRPVSLLTTNCENGQADQLRVNVAGFTERGDLEMTVRHVLKYFCIGLFLLNVQMTLAGPPFKTDDPQPVDFRHWEFYLASMQEWGRTETGATCPHFEVNYGVVPNVQLHLVAPLGYVHTVEGTHYGYADTELGVKYRFVEETESVPQVGVFPLVVIPTGNEGEQLGSGMVQAYFPAWIQKSWGNLTTYGGGGFWYNPGPGQQNWTFVGWEAQYELSEALALGSEVFYQTASSEDSETSAGFTVGGFVNFNENNHLLFSLGHSITGAATLTGYLGFQLTI